MKDAFGHGSNPFGKRAIIPMLPAHQSRIHQLVTSFAKSESGEGKVPPVLREVSHDPDVQADTLSTFGDVMREGHVGLHDLLHFAHFLGFLGAVAVITVIVQYFGSFT